LRKTFKLSEPKGCPYPSNKEAYSKYWKKKSFADRLEEVERLRAEHYGYDLNNPPRMNKTFARIINLRTGEVRILNAQK